MKKMTVSFAVLLLTFSTFACSKKTNTTGKVASLGNTDQLSTGTSLDETQTFQQSVLKFTKCMRENGVDFPDPQFDANGQPEFNRSNFNFDMDDPTYKAADEACAEYRDNALGQFKPTTDQQVMIREGLLAFSQCMRNQGIDFPDPTFGSNGMPKMEDIQRALNGPSEKDPSYQAAEETCRAEVAQKIGERAAQTRAEEEK